MTETPHDQTGSQAAEGQTKDNVALVSGPPPATAPQPSPAPPKHPYSAKKRRWTNDPAIFWVTLAGVVAVIAYTSVAAWQGYLMRGQLDAMYQEQSPDLIVLTDKLDQPEFLAAQGKLGEGGLGALIWSWGCTNFGRGRAVGVTVDQFIKIEDGFRRSFPGKGPIFGGDMPPGKTNFGMVSSGPLLKNYFDVLMQTDMGINFLIEFRYKDALGKSYSTDVCLSRYKNGAMRSLDPEDCKKDTKK